MPTSPSPPPVLPDARPAAGAARLVADPFGAPIRVVRSICDDINTRITDPPASPPN
ncbi:hypothetical protein [Streptomyces sp. YIM S03343]